jgi:hypothetical protein
LGKISFFEIHGLAGRRKIVKHSLHPDVNVFWGANGYGKTSMLKILHSALSNEATALLRVPFTQARVGFIADNDQEYVRTEVLDGSPVTEVAERFGVARAELPRFAT